MSLLLRLITSVALIAGPASAATDNSPEAAPQSASPAPAAPETPAPESSAPATEPGPAAPNGASSEEKIDINKIDLSQFENTLREIVDKEGGEQYRMSMEDCVRRALENNQDILVAEYEPMKSDADIMSAKGEFDPALRSSANYQYSNFGVATGLGTPFAPGASTKGYPSVVSYNTQTNTEFLGKLKWGTQYDVSMGVNKVENTSGKYIELWSGGLTLTITQPLLQGAGLNANLARVRIAKNSRLISNEQLQYTVLSTVAQVAKSYWDLVGAVEQLKVQQQALDNAERLLDINQKRLKIGTGAAIDIVQAKAGVALRQSGLITAHAQVKNAEDILKQLLGMQDGEALAKGSIIPLNRPAVTDLATDEAASIALAIEHRPDIKSAELAIESAKIDQKQASNAMLPNVALTGSASQGSHNHYMSEVFDGVVDPLDKSFSVGVTGTLSLGNRTARGAHQRATLTVRQAEQQWSRSKQIAARDVSLSIRSLETSRTLVASNRNARALQETNLAAEEKRLNLGVSTSYQVLLKQQDLTSAQTQEVGALIQFEKAVIDLRSAQGTLLDDLGIAFEPPATEKPEPYLKSLIPEQWR
ncbi:MAG: TolC family protein [Candidatus Hydrogenedentes bacterium]|nr:TolC family protein [Candidatus Hydrogenedentota bacterium]